MKKKKNRLHRKIALTLTVALLAVQSHVFVSAEEDVGGAPQMEIFTGEINTDVVANDGNTDSNNAENNGGGNTNSGFEQGGVNTGTDNDGDEQGGVKNDGADNQNPENNGNTGNTGNQQEDGNRQDSAGDQAGGTQGGQDQCVCETACTEDAINAKCPVCAVDYANCAKNVGGGVKPSEETAAVVTASGGELDVEAVLNEGIAAFAAEEVETYEVGDEFSYEYGGKSLTYKVTGDGEVAVAQQKPEMIEGDIVIPEEVSNGGSTYRVTNIEQRAFSGCKNLISVTIPDSVTSIERETFYKCYRLTSVMIPNSVTSIEDGAFCECGNLPSVTIPDRVTSIKDKVFYGCRGLTSVTIPNSVTSIGDHAFYQCKLPSVTIPNSVTSIGDYAFAAGGLTSVTIPDSVTSIGAGAFFSCGLLTSITIPDSVTSIGDHAFNLCDSLPNITIPDSVTSIEEGTFRQCTNLSSVTIPNSVTCIGETAFHLCNSLTSITIPDSVTSIGDHAFSVCENLTSVTIPNSVTSIGASAFSSCGLLTSITIPDSVTSIEDATYNNCGALESITISDKVSSIGEIAFSYCEKLQTMEVVVTSNGTVVPPQVENTYGLTFQNCPDGRKIVFKAADGSELTGEDFEQAKGAYLEAGKKDGNPDDGKWYGWKIKEPTEEGDTYKVIVNANKDGQPWTTGCDRVFVLSQDGGATILEDLGAVKVGTYTIYDATRLFAGDFYAKPLNTGVLVTVTDADVSATVDYYTVTFYDCDAAGKETAYGDTTDQGPQIVLKKGGRVTMPVTDPVKEGVSFFKWVTVPGGDAEFDFGMTEITKPTKIYAKWRENTVPVHTYTVTVNVKKDGNPWEGHGREFALLKEGGFLSVPGQAANSSYQISQVPNGVYHIYDVTGVPAEAFYSRARDTGTEVRVSGMDTEVSVTVTDADASADVPYYTVTFYDLDAAGNAVAYENDTDQKPQLVLNRKTVQKPGDPAAPLDPAKAGWQFEEWKTEAGASYDFNSSVTVTTRIFAGWVEKKAEKSLLIKASASEGGSISPAGEVAVKEGDDQSFTITPDEGYRIKAVMVDGTDVTAGLTDTATRAQTRARYYTFSNITQSHTIHVAFETDGGDTPNPNPGDGGDKPGGGDDNKPGGGDDNKPGGGDDNKPGGGDDNKPDGGDDNKPGGGSGTGDKPSDGGNTGGGNHSGGSGGNTDMTGVSGTVSISAGNASTNSTGTKQGFAGQGDGADSGAATASEKAVASDGAFAGASVQGASEKGTTAGGAEPKTGDASMMEIYATLAMVAGMTYLLLYVMEESRGMSEREKDVFVAAFIRWGKKGGAFRKCCAVAAIFCLLMYYHILGKRAGQNADLQYSL